MPSTYTYHKFVEEIDFQNGFETIFELGARDGVDTLQIFNFYEPKNLYTFEADPESYKRMIEFLKKQDLKGQVRGFNLIVSNKIGPMDFWRHPDHGSSSIIKHPRDKCEKLTVNSITLDSFCNQMNIKSIDMICADIEGAEILAFLNQRIMHTVKYVICECAIKPSWKTGYPLLSDLDPVLAVYGLKRTVNMFAHEGSAGNFLYLKQKPTEQEIN